MPTYDCVSFTTDFGLQDGYAGVCHGVVLDIASAVRIIDVSHLVAPGNVRQGSLVMARAAPHLPAAVHVGVVDPGVGSERRAIAVAAGPSILIGPDNGLLIDAAESLGGVSAAYELTKRELWRAPVSRTFHGRDIFSPVAAHVATGLPLADVGAAIDVATLVRLPAPADGEAVDVDRFGNVALSGDRAAVTTGDNVTVNGLPAVVAETYADVQHGQLVVYIDSDDRLAIAVRGGSAAERLRVRVGDVVEVRKT